MEAYILHSYAFRNDLSFATIANEDTTSSLKSIEKELEKSDRLAWYHTAAILLSQLQAEDTLQDSPIVITLQPTAAAQDALRLIQASHDGYDLFSDLSRDVPDQPSPSSRSSPVPEQDESSSVSLRAGKRKATEGAPTTRKSKYEKWLSVPSQSLASS